MAPHRYVHIRYQGNLYQKNDRNAIFEFLVPEFGISDCRFSCYARFPIGAYYICPPNNMDGKMQNCKVQMKFNVSSTKYKCLKIW